MCECDAVCYVACVIVDMCLLICDMCLFLCVMINVFFYGV